jgi:hypothetical protein
MIDIDVLKRRMLGSPEGARTFAAFLRTRLPNLYVEPSTGGKGQHAYLLVRKLGYSAEGSIKHNSRCAITQPGAGDWKPLAHRAVALLLVVMPTV